MNAVRSYPTVFQPMEFLLSSWTGLAGIVFYDCSDHVDTNDFYITLVDNFIFCSVEKID